MRSPALVFLFAPLAVSAAPALEGATIRLFEQADGPVLPFERRLHATRFDATRTRTLGVELAASYPAPGETTTIPLACTLTKPDGSEEAAERPMEFQFFAGQTRSHSASLLWRMPASQRWEPGIYLVQCAADGKPVADAQFEVVLNPAEVTEGEIRVASLRIFPVEGQLPPRALRRYAQSLPAATTKRIGIELEFTHAPLDRTATIPVDCWFFWPDGQTSPPLILSYEPQPTWAGGYSAGAMGWEEAGNWQKGAYTVSCSLYGQPVFVERFDVT